MSFGRSSDNGRGKIVYWEGWVQEFEKTVTVGELMLDHPQQVVVEFDEAVKQKRPIPLPADKTLDMNKVYVMLPIKRGKPLRLNTQQSRRILLILNSALHSKSLFFPSSISFLSRLGRICHYQTPPVAHVHENQEILERDDDVCSEYFPDFDFIEGTTTPEYLSRQLSGKGWKPTLDTIKEKKVQRKMSGYACLFPKRF